MSEFEIVNKTYKEPGRNPKAFSYIEGYTSNTVGNRYLRLNIATLIDEQWIQFYLRECNRLPLTHTIGGGMVDIKVGDITKEGIRLNRVQVKMLIRRLQKWLDEE